MNLREECRLGVLENRALRRISGPKRDETVGGWSKSHKEGLHNLYSLPHIMIKSRSMIQAGHLALKGENRRSSYRVLAGKPEAKRPLTRPRRRWEDDIEVDFREIGWEYGMDSSDSG
jgi:hypothetical protein